MRLSDYDKSVTKYFSSVFPNTVFGYQARHLWEAATDQEDVVVKLPMIGVNRIATVLEFDKRNNLPDVREGRYFDDIRRFMREIPVSLTYQLDFYSESREECDELWREILRYMLDNKFITTETEIDKRVYSHTFPIVIENSPVDNTDVVQFIEKGKLYRVTQEFSIGNAVLLFEKGLPEGKGVIIDIPVRQVVLERNLDADTYRVTAV